MFVALRGAFHPLDAEGIGSGDNEEVVRPTRNDAASMR
jgi:hypothetical protein